MPDSSVRVRRDGYDYYYPVCKTEEESCTMGASYIVPVGVGNKPETWDWLTLCSIHYVRWQNFGGLQLKDIAAYQFHPVKMTRRYHKAAEAREGSRRVANGETPP